MPSAITTHILDTARGVPAAFVATILEWRRDETEEWSLLGSATTDNDGRIRDWRPACERVRPGVYRLRFKTNGYFAALGIAPIFFPHICVEFLVPPDAARSSYHIPLLLSPYGYSTYRGS